jgi:tight adherence protein B
MMVLLIGALTVAALLVARPPGGRSGRIRKALNTADPDSLGSDSGQGNNSRWREAVRLRLANGHALSRQRSAGVPMTVVVQQLAALLKGGRTPSRLWDELWLVYAADERTGTLEGGPSLTPASRSMLSVARAAATRGSPVASAIRTASGSAFSGNHNREQRIWGELAACFEIAEASGCPLADVLTRLAAQLEVEDDAEAARQTALAGPKATVTLLTWLPLLGLGLGVALGVDPLSVLLGTPLGTAALAAGVVLTVAGRIWSARLVRSAIGTP